MVAYAHELPRYLQEEVQAKQRKRKSTACRVAGISTAYITSYVNFLGMHCLMLRLSLLAHRSSVSSPEHNYRLHKGF